MLVEDKNIEENIIKDVRNLATIKDIRHHFRLKKKIKQLKTE